MCDDEKLPKKPEEKPPITENSETNETIDLGTEINKEIKKEDIAKKSNEKNNDGV
jgi:hypothetical protein